LAKTKYTGSDHPTEKSQSLSSRQHSKQMTIECVSYIRISLCHFFFRWNTASMQHLMHHVSV